MQRERMERSDWELPEMVGGGIMWGGQKLQTSSYK